jgi:hypothetical protein
MSASFRLRKRQAEAGMRLFSPLVLAAMLAVATASAATSAPGDETFIYNRQGQLVSSIRETKALFEDTRVWNTHRVVRRSAASEASATHRRSVGTPSPGSPVRSAERAGGCDHRRPDGPGFDAVASTFESRVPDASAEASVASRSSRVGVAAAGLASARQGKHDRLGAARAAVLAG